jgi:glycosyltransferase involved in cell wall biosynthesis
MPIPLVNEKKKIYVVIPAYQAESTLKSVFDRLPVEMSQKSVVYLVINDGSADKTEQVAREIVASRPNVRLVNHEQNRGYAQAQKTGFTIGLQEGADILALLHADGQYAPEMLPALLRPLELGEADLVQGSRMMRRKDALEGGMPINRWLGNVFLSTLENWVYGLKMGEYHSGYMLYSRRALTVVPYLKMSDTFHFDGEMLFVAAKKGLRIKEIPIPTHYGDEKSHLNPITYGFTVLGIMVRYLRGRYNFEDAPQAHK